MILLEWLRKFEGEWDRLLIVCDKIKIQALRFYLAKTPKDWYETNLSKPE